MKIFTLPTVVLLASVISIHAHDGCHVQLNETKINVSGNATVNVPADQIKIDLSAINTGKIPETLIKDNSEKMNSLISSLKSLGLADSEIKTSGYSLIPNWSPKPEKPDKEWTPEIISYTVSNTLSVKTEKLDMAGKIIETVVQKGANKINFISYDLAKPEKFKSEAIKQAIDNAKTYATAIADASGLRLDKIAEINMSEPYLNTASNNYAERINMFMDGAGGAMAAPEMSKAPDIVKGNVSITASVNISYTAAMK